MQTHVLVTTNSRRGLASNVLRKARNSLNSVPSVRNLAVKRPVLSDLSQGTVIKLQTALKSSDQPSRSHRSRPGVMLQQPTRRPDVSGTQKSVPCTRLMSSNTTSVTERHFVHQLYNETKDPLWRLLLVLSNLDSHQDTLYVALQRAGIPETQFNRWRNVVATPNIDEALQLSNEILRKPGSSRGSLIPHWVVLHLIASKVRTASQAHGALLDLLNSHLKTVPEQTHAPYLILTAYHVSRFALAIPLRSVIERFLDTPIALAFPQDIPVDPMSPNPNPKPPPPPALSYNLFLQALTTNPVRSVESANNVVAILKSMDSRQLHLTPSTYLHLLSDRFVTLQLTKYLQERMVHDRVLPTVEHLEAYLRIFSREGAIHDAKKYLEVIHAAVGSQGHVPQEGEYDPRFAANTLFLNAQNNRASAFGFLKSLVEETPVPLPPTKQSSDPVAPTDKPTTGPPSTSDVLALERDFQDIITSESGLVDLETGLLNPASSSSPPESTQQVKLSYKPYRDIYDLTAALHVAAKDLSTSTHRLIQLFMDILKRTTTDDFSTDDPDTSAIDKPTAATYTVLIRGLLLRRQYGKAIQFWERFLKTGMNVDEQLLAAGVIALTRAGRHHVAFQMLEKYCGPGRAVPTPRRTAYGNADVHQGGLEVESLLGSLGDSKLHKSRKSDQPHVQPSIHLINTFLVALLRISRPDLVFRLWTHMEILYGVLPNAQSLSILLQAARRGEGLERHGAGGSQDGWKGIKEKLFGVKNERSGLNPFGSEAWRWVGGPFVMGGMNGNKRQIGDAQTKKPSSTTKGHEQARARLREIAVNDIITALGHPSKGGLRRYTHSVYYHQYTLPSPWQTQQIAKRTTNLRSELAITPLAFARKVFHQALFANDFSHILPCATAPASYLRATHDADGTSAGSSTSSSALSQVLSSLLPLPTPFRPKRWIPEESMTRDMWTETGDAWFPSLALTNANFLNYIALVGLCGEGDAGVAVRRPNKETTDYPASHDMDMNTYINTYFPQKDVDWSIAGPGEIPLVLARMRALGIQPSEATLALSLVLWGEISVGAPLVERFGSGRQRPVPQPSPSPPIMHASSFDAESSVEPQQSTQHSAPAPPPLYGEDGGAEYRRLVDWLRDWVGEDRLPHWRTLRKWQRIVNEMRANLEFGAGRWMWDDVSSKGGGGGKNVKRGIFGSAFWEGEMGTGNSTTGVAKSRAVGGRPPKC